MTLKKRSLRNFRNPMGCLILLAAFAAAAGCSTANKTGGDVIVNHVNASGNSVPGWVTPTGGSHANSATMNYIANGGSSSCTECHGSDLAGGISRVSCFSGAAGCHHSAGWVAVSPAAQNHGISAKKAPGSSGFASCQICHGNDFSGGGSQVSCFNNNASCHGAGVVSPHPSRWRTSTGGTYNHNSTDLANASVCFGCHDYRVTGNPNNPTDPTSPASAGTAPGCYNGTMCHNQAAAPHATGSTWLNAGTGFHGTGAKSDLTSCQGCHGTPGTINFNGGSAPTACSTCHTASKAHPTDWQGLRTINGVTITHRTSGNRDVACAICHNTTGPGTGPNPSAPSCFSASFTNAAGQARSCHSGGPGSAPHALGATWLDPATGGSAFHGTTAKADLLSCQVCHGTPPRGFSGGTATTACTTCHTAAAAHPTDWQGVRAISTASISHRTSGNRTAACGICHNVTAPGAGPNPAAPSCFSANYTNGSGQARACHVNGPGQPNHAVPFFDNTAHTQATTATFTADCGNCHDPSGSSTKTGPVCTTCHIADPRGVTNCTSCHANPPTGAATEYPNAEGAHTEHLSLNAPPGTPVSCSTCHNGLGSGTLSHYNRTRPTRVSPGSVAFVTTYNASGVTAAFDNSSLLRCTNVSCHGGQATPNWRTGTITVASQCTSCHDSGGQFNSYTWGGHNEHIADQGIACTGCHNTATLAVNHFTALATPAMEGPASATIGGAGTSVTSYSAGSCTPQGGIGCHGNRTW